MTLHDQSSNPSSVPPGEARVVHDCGLVKDNEFAMIPYDETAARQDPAVRLNPAFIAAASEIRSLVIEKYPNWRDIPRIMTSSEAFDSRMAAMSAGPKARVDFKRAFAKFAKARLVGFEQGYADGTLFRYKKPIE